jgi:hypothetical protein
MTDLNFCSWGGISHRLGQNGVRGHNCDTGKADNREELTSNAK